jgi:uncharacterized protein YcaQ
MNPILLSLSQARRIWLQAQRLDTEEPFGTGAAATPAAVAHLGYVQIDTIHVIERCHHHILFTRIPSYRREHLQRAQGVDKTVFEFWTHALSYLPAESLRYYVRQMREWRRSRVHGDLVAAADLRRVLGRIRRGGAVTIRDLDTDIRIEKTHAWGSRKPSKRVLEAAFYQGLLTVSRRRGMVKTYELLTRHFGWKRLPPAASERETLNYLLDRALRAQGIVSIASATHLDAPRRRPMLRLIGARVGRGELVPVRLKGEDEATHWVCPEVLDRPPRPRGEQVHVLSPFDPLIIQRKRLLRLFDYDYRFEAYVPREKRVYGYFVCPVLIGDRVVAALDLKTDREQGKLLIQRWNWVERRSRSAKQVIEGALDRFEEFQLARGEQ